VKRDETHDPKPSANNGSGVHLLRKDRDELLAFWSAPKN
jgi:hypothetical protein